MPYNCHFQPSIVADAPAGQTIRFNSTNPLVLYLTPTETCTTRAGEHTYEANKWVSGEGAMYTIPAGVTVKAVQYRETGYDTTFAGSFECDDEDFNVLWKKAARTAYVCMRDHFYDCPDRERVGFWGDGTPELDQCFYVFDRKSDRLCRDLVLRKLQPKFYPGQHLEFLGRYGLWFYYLQTGDLDSIRIVYDQTKHFLFDVYQFGHHGTWFDWGNVITDTAVIEECFYYIDLQTLREMAQATGHDADVPAIDAKLKDIRDNFDRKYWQGRFYMSSQVKTPDDRANAMAVNAGLADRAKWPAIYDNVLTQKTNASSFFDRWVFEALCIMGHEDYALVRMAKRYATEIPCSFTTLWEHYDRWWGRRDRFDAASSLNHGWNPPALFLSQTIAGISPEAPGWSRYHVLPKEAFLRSIKCVVPSIKGDVRVAMRKGDGKYSLELTSPTKTTAVVGIPRKSFTKLNRVRVGGKVIWDGAYRGGVAGVGWVGEEDGYLKFTAAPGTWKFQADGDLRPDDKQQLDSVRKSRRTASKAKGVALDKKTWTARASVPDGTFPFSGRRIPIDASAANALDGDHWTGWRDMTETQHPGQWFEVDMKRPRTFARLVLDNTWAQWDSPAKYSVSVSDDGEHWSKPIAQGAGELGITEITFEPQTARYIRITQTGASDLYHWSIFELDVYAPGK